jgi:hypothetical protein
MVTGVFPGTSSQRRMHTPDCLQKSDSRGQRSSDSARGSYLSSCDELTSLPKLTQFH